MHSVALMGRNWLPKLLAGQMPKTRPMDNVAVALDGRHEVLQLLDRVVAAGLHKLLRLEQVAIEHAAERRLARTLVLVARDLGLRARDVRCRGRGAATALRPT